MNLNQIKALRYTWLLPRLLTKSGLRRACGLPISNYAAYRECVTDRVGLEIAGPSAVFRRGGLIPIYDCVKSLDNCVFASNTIWAEVKEGPTFQYSPAKPPGMQYIVDAAELPKSLHGRYDFLLSCHMIEHTANPIRTLREWRKLLRPEGNLILLLPDKRWTFDHLRPVTTIEHLLADYEAGTQEDDQTHVPEALRLHDLSRNFPLAHEDFERRVRNNFQYRQLHHHVFDTTLVRQMLTHSGFDVRLLTEQFPYHLVALARLNDQRLS